jgi:hypothetical protein
LREGEQRRQLIKVGRSFRISRRPNKAAPSAITLWGKVRPFLGLAEAFAATANAVAPGPQKTTSPSTLGSPSTSVATDLSCLMSKANPSGENAVAKKPEVMGHCFRSPTLRTGAEKTFFPAVIRRIENLDRSIELGPTSITVSCSCCGPSSGMRSKYFGRRYGAKQVAIPEEAIEQAC